MDQLGAVGLGVDDLYLHGVQGYQALYRGGDVLKGSGKVLGVNALLKGIDKGLLVNPLHGAVGKHELVDKAVVGRIQRYLHLVLVACHALDGRADGGPVVLQEFADGGVCAAGGGRALGTLGGGFRGGLGSGLRGDRRRNLRRDLGGRGAGGGLGPGIIVATGPEGEHQDKGHNCGQNT